MSQRPVHAGSEAAGGHGANGRYCVLSRVLLDEWTARRLAAVHRGRNLGGMALGKRQGPAGHPASDVAVSREGKGKVRGEGRPGIMGRLLRGQIGHWDKHTEK